MRSSSSTFNGGMCLWREVQAKLENCPRNLPCFVRFCLFLVPYVSDFVFCFCRETNYVALSHRGRPMEHSSVKVQRLACSILFSCAEVVVIVYQALNRLDGLCSSTRALEVLDRCPAGNYSQPSSRKIMEQSIALAEHWMSHLSDHQLRRKVNHLDLQSTILRFMLKL